ncbi:DUF2584 family protein [Intestinibacter bartlettii]|uniref:DUF2584 family protein n=1 Tax=Intestinibacter bartlettii TaxID=261299 RepID=UPI000822EDE4|nr:DUF2584 family protein [Intestinibacter bartlettii]SCI51211.1 Uncharacterised protein [uncultured Clostridium sp.]
MGVLYEMNWYLVLDDNDLKQTNQNEFICIKNDKRIYPLDSPIPIIFKNEGCIGLVSINSFKVYKNTTEINFSYVKKFDFDSDISKHYYDMYLHMKNKS